MIDSGDPSAAVMAQDATSPAGPRASTALSSCVPLANATIHDLMWLNGPSGWRGVPASMLTGQFAATALASMREKFGSSAAHAARNASTSAALRSSARAGTVHSRTAARNAAARVTSRRSLDRLDDFLRGVVEIAGRDDVEVGLGDDLLAFLHLGALQAHDQRHAQAHFLDGGDYAFGDDVAAHDAA